MAKKDVPPPPHDPQAGTESTQALLRELVTKGLVKIEMA